MILPKPMQNRRSDVVRQVADNSWAAATLGSRGGKVELENILLDDRHLVRREFLAQPVGEFRIQFNCDYVTRPRNQGLCHRTAARSNLDHRGVGAISYRSGNSLDGLHIVKKVLTELRLGGHGHSRW